MLDLLVQEAGPGRSTRCWRCFEFQDQRQTLKLHEEKPFFVKLNRNGPNRKLFRKISPMCQWLPTHGGKSHTCNSGEFGHLIGAAEGRRS